MRSFTRIPIIALAAAACGDPLVTAETRGDPLFSVRGSVSQGLQAPPTAPLEVGVLWMNYDEGVNTVNIEATPADVIGDALPAAFDVSVLRAPSDRMLGTTLVSYDDGGGSTQPVDRNRVAFGVVVVAPQGTFAALPASASMTEFINSSDATPGPLLASFTYVSPFTVRYVKNASAEGLTIRDINGVKSALDDFTLFDVDAWARGIETAACRDRKLGEGWATDEVNACIAAARTANDAAPACREACGVPSEELDAAALQTIADCRASCPPERTSQDIENTCLYVWSESQQDAVDAACGPVPDPAAADFRNSRRLSPSDALTLPLGVGDIRGALTFGGFIFLG